MTETNKRFIRTIAGEIYDSENDSFIPQDYVGKPIEYEDECIKLLNELHEENQSLKFDNKELIRFITSKGYSLQDYIKFIGQFQSVGVNKEDWE